MEGAVVSAEGDTGEYGGDGAVFRVWYKGGGGDEVPTVDVGGRAFCAVCRVPHSDGGVGGGGDEKRAEEGRGPADGSDCFCVREDARAEGGARLPETDGGVAGGGEEEGGGGKGGGEDGGGVAVERERGCGRGG